MEQPTSLSHVPFEQSQLVMMTSLAPACYFMSTNKQWPVDARLTHSRAKAPDSCNQAEQLDSLAQTGPSGCNVL